MPRDAPQATLPASHAPRAGVRFLGSILALFALVAIYTNVQKMRAPAVETVSITRMPAAAVSPSPRAP